MYCKLCGKKIDLDSIFCSYCGSKQSETHKPYPTNNRIEKKPTEENKPQTLEVKLPAIQPKFDLTYNGDPNATAFGILLLIISIIFLAVEPSKFESQKSLDEFRIYTSLFTLFIRIISTAWVVAIARRQNRETSLWGILAFLFPSICLIIIGQKKKLYAVNAEPVIVKTENPFQQNEAEPEFGYKITSQEMNFDFGWGNYEIINVEYNNGNKSQIYKGVKSGRYFYIDFLSSRTFANSKEDAIKAAFAVSIKKNS